MKKTILLSVLAALCLNFSVTAQDKPLISALKTGDYVPDITINGLFNYRTADGKIKTSAKISEFKGRLLILDFWATWCSPCVAMIPAMEQMQAEWGNRVQFLPVAYQPAETVLPFLAKRKKDKAVSVLPGVTGDHTLSKLFPHTYLPHYVWIGPDAKVMAITGHEEVTSANIKRLLSGEGPALVEKQDGRQQSYDNTLPLFINNNGGDGKAMIYHSLLSNYTPGLPGGFGLSRDSLKGVKMSVRNNPVALLYRVAFWDKDWFGENRTVIAVKDPSKLNSVLTGAPYLQWLSEGNGYSYELTLPLYLNGKENEIMRAELDRFFPQYQVAVEKRKTRCFALVRTSDKNKIHSQGGEAKAEFSPEGFQVQNTSLWYLVQRLNMVYFQNEKMPLSDETRYEGTVDLQVNAPLTNIAALNEQLRNYDLELREKELPIDMLVFRDRPALINSAKP